MRTYASAVDEERGVFDLSSFSQYADIIGGQLVDLVGVDIETGARIVSHVDDDDAGGIQKEILWSSAVVTNSNQPQW